MNSRHSIGIHGYLLVYSVTSRQSLEMVKIIRDKILNHTVHNPPPLPTAKIIILTRILFREQNGCLYVLLEINLIYMNSGINSCFVLANGWFLDKFNLMKGEY